MTHDICEMCGRKTDALAWIFSGKFEVLACTDQDACREHCEEMSAYEPEVCLTCGTEERLVNEKCAWCRANEQGRPYGGCPDCLGARARDGTCACAPTLLEVRRRKRDRRRIEAWQTWS